jgi:hypothetical protein
MWCVGTDNVVAGVATDLGIIIFCEARTAGPLEAVDATRRVKMGISTYFVSTL